MPKRLPRKRYKQLLNQIWKGIEASDELHEIIVCHRPECEDPIEDLGAGGRTVFDPSVLPDTIDKLLETP